MPLFTSKRWKPWNQRKPSPASKINWNNPTAKGLVWYAPLLEGAGQPRDYVKGSRAAAGGVWGHVNAGTGYGLYADRALIGYRDVANWPDDSTLNLTSQVSVAALCVRGTATNGVNPVAISKFTYVSESSNAGYALYINAPNSAPNNNLTFAVFNNNGNAVYALQGSTAASNQALFMIGTWGSGTSSLYQGMTSFGTKAVVAMAAPTGSGVRLGHNVSDLLMVIWAGIWNRVLTAREISQMSLRPYDLLVEPPPRLFWFVPSTGGLLNRRRRFLQQ